MIHKRKKSHTDSFNINLSNDENIYVFINLSAAQQPGCYKSETQRSNSHSVGGTQGCATYPVITP